MYEREQVYQSLGSHTYLINVGSQKFLEEKMDRLLEPGRYRHYKGKFYEVIGVARHSESEELLVVYRCLYGDHSLWVRPLQMFLDTVDVDGEEVARFARCPLASL